MRYIIIAQYISNLNFNIPNPKTFFLLSKDISKYKVNIDIKSNQVKEKVIEVQTTLNLAPAKEGFEKIDTSIVYSTIIELADNINNKKEIEKIILIHVPSTIYPELRKIFIFVFENSGFKNIKIGEKVDFQKLYDLRKLQ